MRGNMKTGFRS